MIYLRFDQAVTGFSGRRALLLGSVALALLMPATARADSLAATALPTGGHVTAGSAAVGQSGSTLTVTQTSGSAIINWQTFNIGSQGQVTFLQPSSSAVALNRVTSGIPSQILGKLTANGQVFLLNSAGIVFGQGAQVNVGSLVASTMSLADQDFLSGKYAFQRNGSTASVVNQGTLTAAPGGYIGLLAPTLVNEGTITAQLGTVALAAGEAVTLTLGDGTVSVKVDPATVATLIKNNALIAAPNGQVILTSKAADALLGGAINNGGTISATSLSAHGGTVTLDASDDISLTGKIDVSAATAGGSGDGGTVSVMATRGTTTVGGSILAKAGATGGDGGSIETSGHILSIGGATVDASAAHGKAGSWLLDPDNLTVNTIAASTINTALNGGTSVSLQTTATGTSGAGYADPGNGDIVINSAITWTGSAGLSLSAYNNIDINAAITHSGSTQAALTLTPNTGSGSGQLVVANGGVVTLGSSDSLTIGGLSYTLISTAAQLQAISASSADLAGNYALNGNLDLTGVSFTPIGTVTDAFTGGFAGLGHTISNLTINQPTSSYVGLFGESLGTIADLNLTNVNVTGYSYVGGLIGFNEGTITDCSVSGTVTSATPGSFSSTVVPYAYVGGLAGYNVGSITSSSASGAVVGSGASLAVGGLVGYNMGSIASSYATDTVTGGSGSASLGGLIGYNDGGTISSSFATGAVSGGSADMGGLVGYNNLGTISSSYATGSVTGAAASTMVGGLVGYNEGGSIATSYATGAVTGGSGVASVGGLVGQNTGSVTSSYWDTTTSGTTTGIGAGITSGATGFTTTQIGQQSTFSGFDFTSTWAMTPGGTAPYLLNVPYQASLIPYLTTPVTWVVNSNIITYGTTMVLGSVSLSGVASGDAGSITAVIGLFSGNTQVTDLSNLAPGTYEERVIGLTGSAAGNYTLAVLGNTIGTLTVLPASAKTVQAAGGDSGPLPTGGDSGLLPTGGDSGLLPAGGDSGRRLADAEKSMVKSAAALLAINRVTVDADVLTPPTDTMTDPVGEGR